VKLLTTTQVAEQCAVSVDKVLFWITSKQLLAINLTERVGRQARWRIRQSDLDAFLERRSSVKAAAPVERRSAARMVIPRIVKVS
jgi:excisionase family DNA binding protein